MFCPNCRTEYRWGFSTCSDCGTTLVTDLLDNNPAPAERDGGAPETLWAGQDVSLRDSIRERLDAANISHEDDEVESQFLPAFRESIYRIQIGKHDHDAALNAIRGIDADPPSVRPSPGTVLDRNSELLKPSVVAKRDIWGRVIEPDSPAPVSDSGLATNGSAASDTEGASDDVAENMLDDFDPDEATSQVWSGSVHEMAQTIVICLREVGIGAVIDRSIDTFSVQVEPAAEARAKEIVREIVEQTPPA